MNTKGRAYCSFCYDGIIVKQGNVFFCDVCKKEIVIEEFR
jgi:hypothetical protein